MYYLQVKQKRKDCGYTVEKSILLSGENLNDAASEASEHLARFYPKGEEELFEALILELKLDLTQILRNNKYSGIV